MKILNKLVGEDSQRWTFSRIKYAGKDHLSFLREIHILTSNYPTILKLEGWCVIDKIFILTEYMTKGTLNDKINDSSISCTAELTPTQKQIILYGISNCE